MTKRSKSKRARELKKLPCYNLPKSLHITEHRLKEAIQRLDEDFTYVFCKYGKYEPDIKGNMTLGTLIDCCSKDAALFWLRFHIAETLAFACIFDMTSKHHIQEAARLMLLLPNFGSMKLTDLLRFFALVKAGEYGMLTGCHELLVDLKFYVKDYKL